LAKIAKYGSAITFGNVQLPAQVNNALSVIVGHDFSRARIAHFCVIEVGKG
jgi:hypothetical protein